MQRSYLDERHRAERKDREHPMSTPQDPGRAPSAPALTALPRLEDLPKASGGGYDADRVREAFDAFRRHSSQLQAQLRVLQAAGRSADVEPTGHAVRMDALHLIRAAAEFADTVERDAQQASANQLARTENEVRTRQRELQDRAAELDRYRQESERQRAEILNAARNESRELLQNSQREATQEVREAEARANRLLEQARHQATELTNAARAEVEQTLEWARAQASTVMARAQQGAEQLLGSAGLGEDQIGRVAEAIVKSAEGPADSSRRPGSLPAGLATASGAAQAPEEPPATPPISVTPPAAPPVSPPATSATSADEDEREDPQV
jgi:F0F1-type ATP synthase membrane subunit b/b'